MRKAIISGLALLAMAAAGSGIARAQVDCKGIVRVLAVAGAGTLTEYHVVFVNNTNKTVMGLLSVGGFPSGVKITRPQTPFTLKPYKTEGIVFGNGTDTTINSSTVDFVYDRGDTPRKPAYVRVSSCRYIP